MSPEDREQPGARAAAPEEGASPGTGPFPSGDDAARAALERVRAAARGDGFAARRPAANRRRAEPDAAVAASEAGRGDRPYSRGRDPVPVASSLDRLLAERGWERPLSVASVVGRWREVVGDHLADHCRPETFEDGALVVRADSTAWAMQVRLLLPQLERRLADEVGEGVVESVTVLGPGGPTWRRGPRSVPGRGPRDTYG